MNTMDLFNDCKEPAEIILDEVERLHNEAVLQQREELISMTSQHAIGYAKGKVQAYHNVLEFLRTGESE